jgi:hypothetical protein
MSEGRTVLSETATKAATVTPKQPIWMMIRVIRERAILSGAIAVTPGTMKHKPMKNRNYSGLKVIATTNPYAIALQTIDTRNESA